MQGKPFFVKSILKATFIAQTYLECLALEQIPLDIGMSLLSFEEAHEGATFPMDSLGIMPYEEWNNQFFAYYIQMYNSVI